MNWAAQHELPEGQKTPHNAVQYEHPAKVKGTDCENCRNFIPDRRCRTVKTPVRREDWCIRFERRQK